MELQDLTTVVRRLSKISDNKFETNYSPNLVVIEKDAKEYNGFNIQTKFEHSEDRRAFGKDILRPIEDKYNLVMHQYSKNKC